MFSLWGRFTFAQIELKGGRVFRVRSGYITPVFLAPHAVSLVSSGIVLDLGGEFTYE